MSALLLSAIEPKLAVVTRAETVAYLGPGQLFFTPAPATITTILGSCVAVTLWDPETGTGGMCEYALPHWRGGTRSTRYGDVAIELLVEKFECAGIPAKRLEARVFGFGDDNVGAAREVLYGRDIPIVDEHVHARYAIRVCFRTEDGSAEIHDLGKEIQ
jgi:chemotaxis protein CheD